MKKKFAAILIGTALGACVLSGCRGTDKGAENNIKAEWEDEDAVYGEVVKVGENSVTVKAGTLKAPGKPQEEDTEESQGEDAKEPKERPSMLDLSGKEQEIAVTEETVVKRSGIGGMIGAGEPPQRPDGGTGQEPGGEPPQGEGDKEPPQRPDGDMAEKPNAGMPQMAGAKDEGEEIALSDLSEGDVIRVTFSEDHTAAEITVMSMEGGGENDSSPAKRQDGADGAV